MDLTDLCEISIAYGGNFTNLVQNYTIKMMGLQSLAI